MNASKKSLALGVVLGAALIAIPVTLAIGDSSDPAPAPQAVRTLDAQLNQLGVFRRDRTDADVVPTATSDALITPRLVASTGANVNLSRRAGDTGVSLVPGDGELCIIVPRGMSCRDEAAAVGAPVVTGEGSGSAYVSGLVPDGVQSVTVATAKGNVDAPVQDNAYSVEAQSPSGLSYEGPDGAVRFPFGDALDASHVPQQLTPEQMKAAHGG